MNQTGFGIARGIAKLIDSFGPNIFYTLIYLNNFTHITSVECVSSTYENIFHRLFMTKINILHN